MDRADIVAQGLIVSVLVVVIEGWCVYDYATSGLGSSYLAAWMGGICTLLIVAATLVVAFSHQRPGRTN